MPQAISSISEATPLPGSHLANFGGEVASCAKCHAFQTLNQGATTGLPSFLPKFLGYKRPPRQPASPIPGRGQPWAWPVTKGAWLVFQEEASSQRGPQRR